MKKIINYILYFVMLCFSTSCVYEDAPEEFSRSENGYTYFDFGFKTRTTETTADGGIKNLSLWLIKDGQKEATFYKEYNNLQFYLESDGSYFCLIKEKLNNTYIGNYKVYAIINNYKNFHVELPRSSRASIGGNFDFSNKGNIYFSKAIRDDISNSGIPMYGENSITIGEQNDKNNPATCIVELTRALSKLELNFAHTNRVKSFDVKNITLKNMPDIGYLVYDASRTIRGNKASSITLYSDSGSGTGSITKSATDFTNYTKFQNLGLTNPYLLENTAGDSSPTATAYIPNTDKPAVDGAYQIEVTYDLNNTTKKSTISFPRINRNELFKVYILADYKDENKADIQVQVMKWNTTDISTNYE